MSDIAVEGSADDKVSALQAQLDAAKAELQAQHDDPVAKLQSELAAVQAELAQTKDALAQAQSAPQASAEALAAHTAPSKAQAVLDKIASGAEITSDELREAKDEVARYLDVAGPMKALIDAAERLRQL